MTPHLVPESPERSLPIPQSRDRYRGHFPPCREPPGWEWHKLATTTIGKRECGPLFPGKWELWWKNDRAYAHLYMGVGPRMMGDIVLDLAISALLEAEKLDPKNSQIPEAIKKAQLMARQHGSTC